MFETIAREICKDIERRNSFIGATLAPKPWKMAGQQIYLRPAVRYIEGKFYRDREGEWIDTCLPGGESTVKIDGETITYGRIYPGEKTVGLVLEPQLGEYYKWVETLPTMARYHLIERGLIHEQ